MNKTPTELTPDIKRVHDEIERTRRLQMVQPVPTIVHQDPVKPAHHVVDYVKHLDGVGKVGMLTADAAVSEYEATAKAIEAMGKDLVEMQRRLEAEIREMHAAIDEAKTLAALYREKAVEAFNRIEQASLTVQAARAACTELSEKIRKT